MSGGRVSDSLPGSPLAPSLDKLQHSVGPFSGLPSSTCLLWSVSVAATSSPLNTGQLLTWHEGLRC